jgi:heat shock protein HslJ
MQIMHSSTARHGIAMSVVLLPVLLATGCDETPTGPSDLTGGAWRLVTIDRTGMPSLNAPSGNRFSIEFLADNRLAVRADCNSCGGTYELAGTRFTTGPLACTRAFCGSDSLDTPFLDALTNARAISRDGAELIIRAEGVTLRLVKE